MRTFLFWDCKEYDKTRQVAGRDIKCLSRSKISHMYPDGSYKVVGEVGGKKGSNRIGDIFLGGQMMAVRKYGNESRTLRDRDTYIKVGENEYLAVVGTRSTLLFVILLALIVALAAAAVIMYRVNTMPDEPIEPADTTTEAEETDVHIIPIGETEHSISGTVVIGNEVCPGADVILKKGETEVARTKSDENGHYSFDDILSDFYRLSAEKDGHATVTGLIVSDDIKENVLSVPTKRVKAEITSSDDGKQGITANGLTAVAERFADSNNDVTVTLTVGSTTAVPSAIRKAIADISGDLSLSFMNFDISRTVFSGGIAIQSSAITETVDVIEIIVPYDTTKDVATHVFRYHGGKAELLTAVDSRLDEGKYTDGSYYVGADYVAIYADKFSVYAIGSASADETVKGNITLNYSDRASLSLSSYEIGYTYSEGKNSTHNAIIEMYIKGKDTDYLLARSGTVTPGTKMMGMTAKASIASYLKEGSYEGYVLVKYVNSSATELTDTQISIPVTIYVSR